MATSKAGSGIKGYGIGGEPVPWQSSDMELAPRVDAPYKCMNTHAFTVPFAADADIPDLWPCVQCGRSAVHEGTWVTPRSEQDDDTATGKTHFEHVLARRSREDGNRLVDEALAKLAAARAVTA